MSLQLVKPGLQVMLHDFWTQAAVPLGSEQTLPHWPQLLMSLLILTQAPLQQVPLQQAPLQQIWPAGHTWPHAPQLRTSRLRS
jgi:hypothetical protein